MPVTRREIITQAQMDALADLANSKDIAGKPYEFSEDGGWKDELERLRNNLLSDDGGVGIFTFNGFLAGYTSQPFISGKWPSLHNSGSSSTSSLLLCTPQMVTTRIYSGPPQEDRTFFQAVTQYSDADYYFPEQGSPSITTELLIGQNYARFPSEIFDGETFGEKATYTFKLETSGATGLLSGQIICLFSGFPALQESHFEVFGNIPRSITFNGSQVTATINTMVGSGTYTIGFRRKAGCASFTGAGLLTNSPTMQPLKWSLTETAATEVDGIHSSKKVYKITPPQSSEIGVFPPHATGEGGFQTATDPVGSYGAINHIWYGNQCAIRHSVSSGIAPQGLWATKTLPISEASYAGIPTPEASQPTTSESSITPVSRACELMLPRFHWQRDTETHTPIPSNEGSLGSVIREVYVGRKPVDPEEEGGYWLPDTTSDLAVKLGCIRNGAFVEFETVTIPAGEYGNRIETFWPVFSLHPLVYQCSEEIDVQALAMEPFAYNLSGAILNVGDGVEFPILADHYNDTETLLGLL